jgi:hypothetical protein
MVRSFGVSSPNIKKGQRANFTVQDRTLASTPFSRVNRVHVCFLDILTFKACKVFCTGNYSCYKISFVYDDAYFAKQQQRYVNLTCLGDTTCHSTNSSYDNFTTTILFSYGKILSVLLIFEEPDIPAHVKVSDWLSEVISYFGRFGIPVLNALVHPDIGTKIHLNSKK